MAMAASTLLTMALLMMHGGGGGGGGGVAFTAASVVLTGMMMPHLPAIDPALGNLIPVGDDFGDEEIGALARQRSESASLRYSAFEDQYAFVIGCQSVDDCIHMLESVGIVPALVTWPHSCSLHAEFFSNITSLNVASRVR